MYISVVGNAVCGDEVGEIARGVGGEIARLGHILVCGGLGGVMDQAARGARERSGEAVGILPGRDREGASRWLTIAIPTGMGEGRNVIVAMAGDAMVAVGGGFGTLSEIALALKMSKPVVGIGSWDFGDERGLPIVRAEKPDEAVRVALDLASKTGQKGSP